MRVVYDATFEGYLSLVYEVYYNKISPSEILKTMPNSLLLEDIYSCKYNEEYSQKVLEALRKKFTKKNFATILNIFMCDTAAFEMELLEYIVEGFKEQNNLQNINNSSIFKIAKLEKQLFSNVHKMTGFLRFEELEDGSLYAKLESQFNLVYFLGKHFAKRFNNQVYFIHDIKRSLVFVHSPAFKGVRMVADFELPKFSQSEEKFKKLWREFFESVTIESRKNEKLQKNVVPLLYRTYMSEFMDDKL